MNDNNVFKLNIVVFLYLYTFAKLLIKGDEEDMGQNEIHMFQNETLEKKIPGYIDVSTRVLLTKNLVNICEILLICICFF